MHVLITMQFKGTNYHGFQVQKNAVTVCETLQNAMQNLYGTRPDVKGCSRTDAGVHAIEYCVSFIQPKPIQTHKLPLALNRFLPSDIRVLSAKQVDNDFHARYSAISKEYVYKVHNSHVHNVFNMQTSFKVCGKLNVPNMQKAANLFCGTHEFTSFMSIKSDIKDTKRTIHFLNISQQGDEITFHICANGYLYNMVRIIVGTLIDVGANRRKPEDITQIIEKRNRDFAGDTAPAHGLFLYKVNY